METRDILALLSFGISLVLFLGGAAYYLRGSVDKGTIAALESNNKALTERVKLLEEADIKSQARIEALERENGILLQQRPSADLIAEINRKLDEYVLRNRAREGEL